MDRSHASDFVRWVLVYDCVDVHRCEATFENEGWTLSLEALSWNLSRFEGFGGTSVHEARGRLPNGARLVPSHEIVGMHVLSFGGERNDALEICDVGFARARRPLLAVGSPPESRKKTVGASTSRCALYPL